MKKTITVLIVGLILSASIKSNAQWVRVSNGLDTSTTISSFALSGNNIFAGVHQRGVYLTTDFGNSWTQTALNDQTVSSIIVIEDNLIAGTGGNGLYRSTNNGASWTQTGLYGNTVNTLAVNGNIVFAAAYLWVNGHAFYGIYLSTNIGNSWPQNTFSYVEVYSIIGSGNNVFAGTFNYGVYLSTNNGINWSQTALNNKNVFSLAVNGNNIFAGTFSNGVYLSTNNGTSWSQTVLNNQTVNALVVRGNNVIAGTGGNGVYLSTNNGLNWSQINQGFSVIPGIWRLLITDNYLYAGTASYSIWRRPLSELVGTQNTITETPVSYLLYQNYPNPFNPITKIRYELPRAGIVKLAVYDAMGREIEMLVNEKQAAGSYEATFNGSKYPSGVYFYQITSDVFLETKRMILLK